MKRGFTLTEIAIVLGIIGLILSSVWSASALVRTNVKNTQGIRTILTIVQNMRSVFGPGGSLPAGDLTAAAVAAGVFPPEAVLNGLTVNPWATSAAVGQPTQDGISVSSQYLWACSGANSTSFGLVIWDLPKPACVALLMALTGPAAVGNGLNCAYEQGAYAVNGTGIIKTDGSDKDLILSSCAGDVALGFSLQ